MKIDLTAGQPTQIATTLATDLLIVGVFAAKKDPEEKSEKSKKRSKAAATGSFSAGHPMLAALDESLGGALEAAIAREEFVGKANTTLSLPTLGKIGARLILVIGLGEKSKADVPGYRSFAARASRSANGEKATSLAIVAPDDDAGVLRALAEGLVLGAYRFTKYLTGDRRPKADIESATIVLEKANAEAKAAVKVGVEIGEAVCFARDLVNEPPNVLNAPEMADRAEKLAKEHGIKIQIWDKAEIEKREMRLLLAVNQGSTIEPRVIHWTYTPKKKSHKKLVFVGKGLTFDSGGLCIKPADGMIDMKVDMAGGANVLALMLAVAAIKPDVEVHGIVGATDNMPDGNAYRPGDVFTSLEGKTVEIINTDAEGRLVLADCLAYAATLEPDAIIDNATLTGACMVALGHYCTGWYCNDEDLKVDFKKAYESAGEQMWQMPLAEDLRDLLRSDIADLKHVGTRYGGSITAALFLREFVGDVPWVHCDIAGPATIDKPTGFYVKGATGHGVLTFLELVERYARK